MKKVVSTVSAIVLLFAFAACTPEENGENKNSKLPEGAVDLGIVMTREDGTTYNLYWAKSNLSESGLCANPEDYGDYYAWGETSPKSDYSWSTYNFGTSKYGPFSKYNTIGDDGTVDNKTVLELEDDVAHVKLGGKWRMPTYAEWEALIEQCRKMQNGEKGKLVTGPNGNSIFLPATGRWNGTSLRDAGYYGYYWSSSLYPGNPSDARDVSFGPGVGWGRDDRCYGRSVRPVSE